MSDTTIFDIAKYLGDRKLNEVDIYSPFEGIEFEADGDVLSVNLPNGATFFSTEAVDREQTSHYPFSPTFTAESDMFPQLWGRMGGSVPSFFKSNVMSPDVVGTVLNDRLNLHIEDIANTRASKHTLFRSYNGTLYASLSEKYGIYDPLAMLHDIGPLMGDTSHRVLTNVATNTFDRFQLPVVTTQRNTDDGGYYVGFSMSNGQSGRSSIRIMPFVMRTSCTNSIRYDYDKTVKIRHLFSMGVTDHIGMLLMEQVTAAMNIGVNIVKRALESRRQTIPVKTFNDVLTQLCERHGLDPISTAHGAEGQTSVFGLSNAVTAAARDLWGTNSLKAEELEYIGGNILMNTQDLSGDQLAAALFVESKVSVSLVDSDD